MFLTSIYILANAILASTVLAEYRVNHFASRYGWLAAANMALCTFFAMKNTPFAPIAHVSHNQLNILHRLAGYTAAFLVLLHAIFYMAHFGRQGRWAKLLESGNIEGFGSGVATIVLLLGIFRCRNYQLFFNSHILAFISLLILTALHRPDWAKKLPVVMVVMACIWLADRILRTARIAYNAVNNGATLHPLTDGATRVVFAKPSASAARPGAHCFLWIPRISVYQMHSFTIVNNGPDGLELVIKAQGSYTRALHTLAKEHAGRPIRASIDGPYGSLPEPAAYDKLVLIAGGSGASFAFGLLNRMMTQADGMPLTPVEFVWAVKRTEHLDWFADHLRNLTRCAPTVNITVYVTREEAQTPLETLPCPSPPSPLADTLKESGALEQEHDDDTERLLPSHTGYGGSGGHGFTIQYEKMAPQLVMEEAIQGVKSCDRILIAACGPRGLVDSVRDAASGLQGKDCCEIDIYSEGIGK
ncbi:hypothetical protein BJY01DRAFT_100482 [Aspergillus pseudoustus]|uniref:ferric-chelate reductase (NADPH) n=1 Tax=Aspergillus pseudoustus TaxID=1810923 RepID=A0ABR4KIH2_9EURO